MKKYDYSPGDQPIDDYTIEYALGRGGFGEVYFARSKAGREVALKAILNHEDVELRGVQNCMNLKSSRLLTIYDIKRDAEGVLWIVMEFVRGPSLQDIISESADGLSAEQATFLLRELALGLSDLHNAGIVHRDLKPSNIFFDGGHAKIGDYSLSKTIANHEQSQHTLTVGSVHYMAPEISLGRYDKTVDIYALGVIFYEMLSGLPAHTGETVGEILLKHLHSDVDVHSIDERFQPVIARAMDREPSRRYQSPDELASDALASVDPTGLVDSFTPKTLSLIGERASERREAQRPATSSTWSPIVGETPTDDVVDRRLGETPNAVGAKSTRSIEVRMLMAIALVLVTTIFTIFADSRGGLGAVEGLMFGVATFLAAMAYAYGLLRLPDFANRTRWWNAMQRASTAATGAGLLLVVAASMTPLEIEGLFITAMSCMIALSIIDWRRIVSADRPTTLQWYPTVAAGAIAAAVCWVLRMNQWWIFCTSTAVGIALAVQAVAPLRHRSGVVGQSNSRDMMVVRGIPNGG